VKYLLSKFHVAVHLTHSTAKRHHSGVRLTLPERHQLHNLQQRQFWTVTEREPASTLSMAICL